MCRASCRLAWRGDSPGISGETRASAAPPRGPSHARFAGHGACPAERQSGKSTDNTMHTLRMFLTGALLMTLAAGAAKAADPENTLYMELKDGRVVIALRPDLAPHTVARVKELARQHFYDGLTFHRVIPGFMAQTGDPRGDGTGGSGRSLDAEFSNEPFLRGSVAMARA